LCVCTYRYVLGPGLSAGYANRACPPAACMHSIGLVIARVNRYVDKSITPIFCCIRACSSSQRQDAQHQRWRASIRVSPCAAEHPCEILSVEDWAKLRRLRRAERLPIQGDCTVRYRRNTVKPALAHDEPPKYQRPQRGSIVDEVKPATEQGVEIRLDSSDRQELPAAALVAPTETGQLPSGMLAPPCGLPGAIQEYLDAHNQDPRPYVWTATAESILTKVARGRIALEKIS
jgi:hypothetical protein